MPRRSNGTIRTGFTTKSIKNMRKALKANSKVTKTEVKKMIDKKLDDVIEDKIADYNFFLAVRQSTSNVTGHIAMDDNNQFSVTFGPQNPLPQAITQGGRIANKVKIKSAKLRLRLSSSFQDATANPTPSPQIIRCLLYYDRKDPNNATASPFAPILAGSTETFQAGASDSLFLGNQHDLTRRFNNDRFSVVWQKDYKLGFQYYLTEVINARQQYSNNDFSLHREEVIDYTKHIIKNVKWNDTDLTPSVRGLYFYAYTVNAVNLNVTVASPPTEVNILASTQIIYEDA